MCVVFFVVLIGFHYLFVCLFLFTAFGQAFSQNLVSLKIYVNMILDNMSGNSRNLIPANFK